MIPPAVVVELPLLAVGSGRTSAESDKGLILNQKRFQLRQKVYEMYFEGLREVAIRIGCEEVDKKMAHRRFGAPFKVKVDGALQCSV
jgi:hypothetical protein